jgi:hypothetical protein
LLAPDRVRSLVTLGTSAAVETPEKKLAYLQMQDALKDGHVHDASHSHGDVTAPFCARL